MFSPSPELTIIIPAFLALVHPKTDPLPKIHVIILHILKNKYKIRFLQETLPTPNHVDMFYLMSFDLKLTF